MPVTEELQALERHRLLATTRYGGHVHVVVDVPDAVAATATATVPPVSLGELLPNALKHNVVMRLAAGKTLAWAEEGERFVVRMPISSG